MPVEPLSLQLDLVYSLCHCISASVYGFSFWVFLSSDVHVCLRFIFAGQASDNENLLRSFITAEFP